MHIGIDARLYGSKYRGIGRYAQELINALLEQRDQHVVDSFTIIIPTDQFEKGVTMCPSVLWSHVSWRVYSWKEQCIGAWRWMRFRGDVVHFTHWNVPLVYMVYAWMAHKRFVVTIHDLILRKSSFNEATTRSPLLFYLKYVVYRITLWMIMHTAERIITVSKEVREDIKRLYPMHPPIVVIYEGADHCPLVGERDKRNPWILSVGSAYPHKNLLGALRAFSLFYHAGHQSWKFILCSNQSIFLERLVKQATTEQLLEGVEFRTNVDDAALWSLYAQASMLLLVSFEEGFGFTPLEAIRCGLSVVVSQTSLTHEILGSGALFVDPYDPKAIANGITAIADHDADGVMHHEEALKSIQQYVWADTARETRQWYQL